MSYKAKAQQGVEPFYQWDVTTSDSGGSRLTETPFSNSWIGHWVKMASQEEAVCCLESVVRSHHIHKKLPAKIGLGVQGELSRSLVQVVRPVEGDNL